MTKELQEMLRNTGQAYLDAADGKPIQYSLGEGKEWKDLIYVEESLQDYKGFSIFLNALRPKPAPKMRPIRVDELPPVFMVRNSPNDMHICAIMRDKKFEAVFSDWVQADWEFSTDGVTWKRFEVEA